MQIVYTNLKENDAGLKRSVRQLRVDFNRVEAPAAPKSPPARVAACNPVEARPQSWPDQAAPYCAVPAVAEGMTALRKMLIRKFIDTERFCESGGPSLSITV
jgi:hypothetical protein